MDTYLARLFSLAGKTAVVTGAGRGLGQSMALCLARAGAHVVLCSRSKDQLDETARLIAADGGQSTVQPLDISQPDDVAAVFEQLEQVDIVVNAAAIIERRRAVDLDAATWQRMIDINLSGAFHVARAGARRMLDLGIAGRIVQVASVQADVVLRERVAYTSSKGGMVQMVKSFAYELGDSGITVNAILPGFFKTSLNADLFDESDWHADFVKHLPNGRPGAPEDLDTTLLALVSPASGYTTGSTFIVDGGLTAGIPL